MPRALKERLQNGISVDETDKTPDDTNVTLYEVTMYVVAIIGHFVDVGLDINIAVRYWLARRMMEFGWTLAFITLPAVISTAVSLRMYAQDRSNVDTMSNQFPQHRILRIFTLIFQMAPILRFVDALVYAIKSRRAAKRNDPVSQRLYYRLMLKEDSDAALLRIFECFLEAAPQNVLQLSLLLRRDESFTLHQSLSISWSLVGMAWCLGAYHRAIRFAQEDKLNISWVGTVMQVIWHFLVTLSRVVALAAVAYMYPYWLIVGCIVHILFMTAWLQFYDRSPFCSQNKLAETAFAFVMGTVYLFTYILPIEGRTRYRYAIYYTICFIENLVCALLFFFLVDDSVGFSPFFIPILVLSVVPFLFGIMFMVTYYMYFHPKMGKRLNGITVAFISSVDRPEANFRKESIVIELAPFHLRARRA